VELEDEHTSRGGAMTLQWPPMLLLLALPLSMAVMSHLRRSGKSRWPQIRRGRARGGRIVFAAGAGNNAAFPWRFCLAFGFAVAALARPQWGTVLTPSYASSAEVLIALDLSRSMLATDVAPSRLERARARALQLVDGMPERKIGLMVFAGAAFLVAPASDDHAALQALLSSVMPDDILAQGSDFGALLDAAIGAFSPAAGARSLVILTDGEAESTAWRDRLSALRHRDIRVFTVGFGTDGGALISGVEGKWLQDEAGRPVRSRLNSVTLSELARETHGKYLKEGLEGSALEEQIAAGATGTAGPRQAERFTWFLALALSMLIWSAAHEWPAKPALEEPQAPISTRNTLAVLAVMLMVCAFTLQHARATARAVQSDEADEEDVDALTPLRALVASMVAAPPPTAANYLDMVRATVRYGDAQRGQSGAVASGILDDGVAAAERGHALAPALADWDGLEAALRRLALAPPPLPADAQPPDPANDPMAGSREALEGGGERQDSQGKKAAGDEAESARREKGADSAASAPGLRGVGGSRRQVYDPAEWRDPSLVLPLHQLEQVRATDSPAALFRLQQGVGVPVSRAGKQTW
jgi:Ca-activated chloride channel family protein